MTLGKILKKHRIQKKMTLRDVAGNVGSSHNFIHRLERDEGNIRPIQVMGAIFDIYKIPKREQLRLFQMCVE